MLKKIFLLFVVVVKYVPLITQTSSPVVDAVIAACSELPGKALAQLVPSKSPAPDGVTYLVTAFACKAVSKMKILRSMVVFKV